MPLFAKRKGLTVPVAFRMLRDWDVERYYARKVKKGTVTFRDKVYRFLGSPASSVAAQLVGFTVLVVSIISVCTFGAELTEEATIVSKYLSGLPAEVLGNITNRKDASVDFVIPPDNYDAARNVAWTIWNKILLAFFAFEWIVRAVSYHMPWAHAILWLELLCILPLILRIWYKYDEDGNLSAIELYISQRAAAVPMFLQSALSALRLMKTTQYFLGTKVLLDTLRDSVTALVIPAYLLLMLLMFYGTLLFALEYDAFGLGTVNEQVPNVLSGWWLAFVSMTTVGYGDVTPLTTAGRCLMFLIVISGLVVIAMPLAIVGSQFQRAWDAGLFVLISEQVRVTLLEDGNEIEYVMERLRRIDNLENIGLSFSEFRMVLRELRVDVTDSQLRQAWGMCDLEDNRVQCALLLTRLFPELDVDYYETSGVPPGGEKEEMTTRRKSRISIEYAGRTIRRRSRISIQYASSNASEPSADRAAERLDDFCEKHELGEYCEAMKRAGYKFVGDLYETDAEDYAAGQPLALILDSMKKPERQRFIRLVPSASLRTPIQPSCGANLPRPAVD